MSNERHLSDATFTLLWGEATEFNKIGLPKLLVVRFHLFEDDQRVVVRGIIVI